MKIEEMADISLNSPNFAPYALLTLAPPSDLLRSSFERKIDKTNFIPEKKIKNVLVRKPGRKSYYFSPISS